jgi:cation-transporting P-type ATPase E
MMRHALCESCDLGDQLDEWTDQGLRVLLFACYPAPVSLHPGGDGSRDGAPALPGDLVPLSLVSMSDELRPEVESTIRALEDAGVALKIISGDNPQTVAALARQAGFSQAMSAVSGQDLDQLDDAQLRQVVEEAAVFGRVTPEQKERLVGALRANGHYVAMIGDGVNDVISLKRANVGIAMQGGSQAARAVADMILLKDSFRALPWAFQEGQRIFNGMQDILRLFMVRILAVALLVMAVGFIGGFPFGPRNASMLSFFAGGVPAIALAAFARPGRADRSRTLARIMRFSLPPVLAMGLIGLGLYVGYFLYFKARLDEIPMSPGAVAAGVSAQLYLAQSALMTFCVYCSLLLLPMIAPPVSFFAGGNPVRRSWVMTILAILLAVGFMFAIRSHTGMVAFNVAPLRAIDFIIAGAAAVAWMVITLLTWRHHWLDRFIGLPDDDGLPARDEVAVEGPQGSHGERAGTGAPGARAAVAGRDRSRVRRYSSGR